MADKKSFVMYESWGAAISKMSDAQAGAVIKAIYAYQNDPTAAPEDPALAFVFEIIKQKLDEDSKRYNEVCAARADAGRKGGEAKAGNTKQEPEENNTEKQNKSNLANASKSKQTVANLADTDTESDSDTENKKEKSSNELQKKTAPRFSAPTLKEVEAYCRERKNSVDAQRFVDYYASNGWKVGKSPMKDWQAAVRTWEHNGYSQKQTPSDGMTAAEREFFAMAERREAERNDTGRVQKPAWNPEGVQGILSDTAGNERMVRIT